ncbi:DUF4169 family protein [Allorhizobium terrae]|uniref:DUF4169 family protein n=1 Tax=Allorhizobium terrae TaxID=1848972 RepID=A0A4S4A5X5_9HYPH|nr:DUF4169 family protein [Allorhizobium terrae]THF53951.1 DUF4169 family protein [Allorhizobium terrae]TWD58274.1 uncharacterized protein DUF4169 [Agrobacterium vitis]
MSGDVVNLRQFKKAKARVEKEKAADQNRLTFGRTKAEKNLTSALNKKAEKALDQSRLERSSNKPTDQTDA